jgi:hypothetical protein
MKVTTAFCDIHTDVQLAPASILTRSSVGDINTFNTDRCTNPSCIRNYTREFGYFDALLGESFKFGDVGCKHRCGWNHPIEYMILTKLDGVLTWACPVEKCRAIKPYGAVSQFTLHATGGGRDGHAEMGQWNDIHHYVVRHLPAGEEAWIARMYGTWSTLRATNGIQRQWVGQHNDLKEALQALTAEFEIAPAAV